MRFSKLFAPILRNDPQEAQVLSHRLMLKTGMIRQLTSGIYNWLPLGLNVMNKVANIIRDELKKWDAQEILMPTIQPASLWIESERYDAYGKEMLRITDRHENKMLFGPTNEEVVTDIFRKNVTSYRSLPMNLYQIQWKFRDEIRPRFGVMRGREFLMKDAYSFDLTKEEAEKTYFKMFTAYLNIFKTMGLKAIPIQADSGPIGGSLSHEFHILASTGESDIYYDKEILNIQNSDPNEYRKFYAMADEMHVPEKCNVEPSNLAHAKGVEVGHIFHLGTKYSNLLNAKVTNSSGEQTVVEMGCYGIGVSRVVAAIIEACHDEKGIVWPLAVAPYKVAIIPLRKEDQIIDLSEKIYSSLQNSSIDVILDDTENSAGEKFANHDLLGWPIQIIIGPKLFAEGKLEIKIRETGEKIICNIDDVINKVINLCSKK